MLTLRGNIAVSGSRLIYGVKASSQKNDHNPMDAIQLNYLTTTPPPPSSLVGSMVLGQFLVKSQANCNA